MPSLLGKTSRDKESSITQIQIRKEEIVGPKLPMPKPFIFKEMETILHWVWGHPLLHFFVLLGYTTPQLNSIDLDNSLTHSAIWHLHKSLFALKYSHY